MMTQPTNPPSPPFAKGGNIERQRKGLLAKIHIAKQQLKLTQDEYEAILAGMKAESAATLTVPQLERLVTYLAKLGFKAINHRQPSSSDARGEALRRRCEELARGIENGEKRLAGLAEKICGVSNLAWCRDVAKLQRLLAVLGKIKTQEVQKEAEHGNG